MRRLLAVGALAMLAQVALLRECAVMSFGIELAVVLALGAWLLGSAAGAASGGRRGAHGDAGTRARFVLLGLTLPLAVVTARGARLVLGGVPGGYLPLERQALALVACLAPSAFVLGVLFRRTAAAAIGPRRTLAGAYALECAGGLAGGLLATVLPLTGVSDLATVLLAAALAFAVAAAPPWRGARAPALAGAAGLVLALAALAAGGSLDWGLTAWNHPRLVATRDTPYARVTVTGSLGQTVVFEDDALAYDSEGTAAEEFVQLAAIQREPVGRVLVLGGAATGLLPEVLRHRPEHVDDVEMDRALLALVTPLEPAAVRAALADPRVTVRFADPRRALAWAGRYDLVLVGLPEPASGRTNRFYTREFFAACAARMTPAGVLALRLRASENLWTPLEARRAAGIHRALRAVFPATVVLPGVTNVLLASRAPLDRDPAVLGARLAARATGARLVTPAYVRYLYTNDRFTELAALLERTPALPNTDGRPACYAATMLLWVSRFAPSLARLEPPTPDLRGALAAPPVWAVAAAVALALRAVRRRPGARRALLALLSGGAGMMLESVVMLHHQTRSGALHRDLGVLLMAFMAGLALGAGLVDRALRGVDRAAGARAVTATALAALAALALAGAALVRGGWAGGLGGAAALLLGCGALVGGVFAGVAHADATTERALAGPLYAADVAGGCAGSMVAALVAIPLLGMPATAALAGLLAAAGLLLA